MKLGLHVYDFPWPGGASQLGPMLVKITRVADEWGCDNHHPRVVTHIYQIKPLEVIDREVIPRGAGQ
jgi:hypothetical protein